MNDYTFFFFGILLICFAILLAASGDAKADQVYCNQYGSSTVCNTYRESGNMDSTTFNQYGNTTVGTSNDSAAGKDEDQ